MAIANEDGLVVDLMLGRVSTSELRSSGVRALDVDRIDAVNRLMRLIDAAPDHEPPVNLLERTLARCQDRTGRALQNA
ncbi:MAG: hypothetical protein QM770_07355 [Tepidisphaeraceae bacterium]